MQCQAAHTHYRPGSSLANKGQISPLQAALAQNWRMGARPKSDPAIPGIPLSTMSALCRLHLTLKPLELLIRNQAQ